MLASDAHEHCAPKAEHTQKALHTAQDGTFLLQAGHLAGCRALYLYALSDCFLWEFLLSRYISHVQDVLLAIQVHTCREHRVCSLTDLVYPTTKRGLAADKRAHR